MGDYQHLIKKENLKTIYGDSHLSRPGDDGNIKVNAFGPGKTSSLDSVLLDGNGASTTVGRNRLLAVVGDTPRPTPGPTPEPTQAPTQRYGDTNSFLVANFTLPFILKLCSRA